VLDLGRAVWISTNLRKELLRMLFTLAILCGGYRLVCLPLMAEALRFLRGAARDFD